MTDVADSAHNDAAFGGVGCRVLLHVFRRNGCFSFGDGANSHKHKLFALASAGSELVHGVVVCLLWYYYYASAKQSVRFSQQLRVLDNDEDLLLMESWRAGVFVVVVEATTFLISAHTNALWALGGEAGCRRFCAAVARLRKKEAELTRDKSEDRQETVTGAPAVDGADGCEGLDDARWDHEVGVVAEEVLQQDFKATLHTSFFGFHRGTIVFYVAMSALRLWAHAFPALDAAGPSFADVAVRAVTLAVLLVASAAASPPHNVRMIAPRIMLRVCCNALSQVAADVRTLPDRAGDAEQWCDEHHAIVTRYELVRQLIDTANTATVQPIVLSASLFCANRVLAGPFIFFVLEPRYNIVIGLQFVLGFIVVFHGLFRDVRAMNRAVVSLDDSLHAIALRVRSSHAEQVGTLHALSILFSTGRLGLSWAGLTMTNETLFKLASLLFTAIAIIFRESLQMAARADYSSSGLSRPFEHCVNYELAAFGILPSQICDLRKMTITQVHGSDDDEEILSHSPSARSKHFGHNLHLIEGGSRAMLASVVVDSQT